jgi:hypothetical protein
MHSARAALLRFQAGLREQRKKLALRALVNGDSRQFAVAVEDKRLGDSSDVELLVHRATRVDEYRRVIVLPLEE